MTAYSSAFDKFKSEQNKFDKAMEKQMDAKAQSKWITHMTQVNTAFKNGHYAELKKMMK